VLTEFIRSFDFARMKPAPSVIKGGLPEKAKAYALVEPGRQYAVHVFGGTQANLLLDLPSGIYQAEWINTKSGAVDKHERLQHTGGLATLASPPYQEDIALRVRQ